AMLDFTPAQRLLLCALLVLQVYGSAGTIATAYGNRMEHVRVLAAQEEVNRCLEKNVGPLQNYKTVVAMLDPGFKPPGGRGAIEGFDGYRALRDRRRIDELYARGEPFLLLASRRLAALNGVNLNQANDMKDAKSGACDAVQYLAYRPAEK